MHLNEYYNYRYYSFELMLLDVHGSGIGLFCEIFVGICLYEQLAPKLGALLYGL